MPASTDWPSLLDEERRLLTALLDTGEPMDPHALRRWWSVVGAVLKGMVRPDGRFAEQLPMELFAVLGGLAGYLEAGQVPVLIAGVSTKGRASPGPAEVRDIRVAVTYRRVVQDKLIDDPYPVKTIMTAYGLRSRRTVEQWCERHPPLDLSVWKGMPQALAAKMCKSGEVYRAAIQRTWSRAKATRRPRVARK